MGREDCLLGEGADWVGEDEPIWKSEILLNAESDQTDGEVASM